MAFRNHSHPAALVADGSAAAPSVAFAADTNSGIYRISGDRWALAVGGSKILEIWNDAGSLKIGNRGVAATGMAAHIPDPSGGITVDATARTAINAILVVLENHGMTFTS